MSELTCFSEGLDRLARQSGAWADDAIVHSVEMVNERQVLLTGATPVGIRRDGGPKFAPISKAKVFKAFVTLEQYRAALSTTGA